MNRKIRIGIIWANPYNKNLGVAALAYSALLLLHDVAKKNNIEAELSFFGSGKNVADSITINGETITYKNIFGMDFFLFKSKFKLLFFGKRFQKKAIDTFDYVFDIAEGDSFTDIYGDVRFRKILNSKKYFATHNIKQVLLPQTIGPFKEPVHEKDAFDIMKKLRLIISRDKMSYDYTAKFLPADKIVETIDVAFYMPFEKTVYNNGKINVGINISGLLWNGGYTKNNQFGMKTDYKKLVLDTTAYFNEQENVQIHFVPHVIPLNHKIEDDYEASEEVKALFPNVVIAPRFNTPIEAKGYISGLDFFTGARMHACIAAFSTGVSVYPMAYSRKFNGLFKDTLQYKHMGDCVNDSTELVLDALKNAFDKRAELKAEIELAHKNIVAPRISLIKDILSKSISN